MFTLAQKKAHDPIRHISITANAGSGKTRVLVGRYCDLVEGVIPGVRALPDEIAAITFTEKAAAELRERIASELERRLDDDAHRPNWPRLRRAREGFTGAIVSTIHGFCSALLREYPIEANVPPGFTIAQGFEGAQMRSDAVMEAIEWALGEENPRVEEAFDLARRMSREKLESTLRFMMGKREAIWYARQFGGLLADRGATLDDWNRRLVALLRSVIGNAEVRPALARLHAALKPESSDDLDLYLAELDAARDPSELVGALARLREHLLTNDGKGLRKRAFANAKEDLPLLEEEERIVVDAFRRARQLIESHPEPEAHEQLFDDQLLLLEIHDDAVERYRKQKERLALFDFDDLQIELLKALEGEHRDVFVGRFRYLMIDEFQDTNELQYALARRLLDELRVGQLCIVGDEKQSIYGFRNAEVEVFRSATEEIMRANRDLGRSEEPLLFADERLEPETREEQLGEVRLTASFRLLPANCAYVNASCAPVMKRSGAFGFGVEYEPLVCARRSEGSGAIELIVAPPPPKRGAVEEEEGDDAEEGATGEEELIARRLAAIVRGGEEVWEMGPEGVERPRPARYGDIAILCRKRSQFAPLEAALRREGVPFLTSGGIGYYRTQEVYDVMSYLRLLVGEKDDVAALGLLRSPFFAVSDAELFRLTLDEKGRGSLWQRAVARVASGNAEPALQRAVSLVADDRDVAGRISIPMLIRRILERTGWRGTMLGTERGEQAIANVEKLIEQAREFEQRGFVSLVDFIARIGELIDSDEREGEAPVGAGRDAVLLMTMHASKGLEFPIVVIPSLHLPARKGSEPWFDKELGLGWSWQMKEIEVRPTIVPLMALRGSERERAEEARLFYVAITRGRDRLILSAAFDDEDRPRDGMLAWALAPLPPLPEENGEIVLPPNPLSFLAPDGVATAKHPVTLRILVHRAVAEAPPVEHTEVRGRDFPVDRLRVGPVASTPSGETYSPTQLQLWSSCPSRYYLRYRLGLSEEVAEMYGVDRTTRGSEEGLALARALRRTLERASRVEDLNDRLVHENVRLEVLGAEQRERIGQELGAIVAGLRASAHARRLLFAEAGTQNHSGADLRRPCGEDYLHGLVDHLRIAGDGTLHFTQLRTRRIAAAGLGEAADEARVQMRTLAWLVAPLADGGVIEGTLLFVRHPEQPITHRFEAAELAAVEEEILAAIGAIRSLDTSPTMPIARNRAHCPSCPYFISPDCLLDRV